MFDIIQQPAVLSRSTVGKISDIVPVILNARGLRYSKFIQPYLYCCSNRKLLDYIDQVQYIGVPVVTAMYVNTELKQHSGFTRQPMEVKLVWVI